MTAQHRSKPRSLCAFVHVILLLYVAYAVHFADFSLHFYTSVAVSTCIEMQQNLSCVLTARYCGPSEFSPVRFPHIEAALSCCICCCSCWAMRFCSLSFCVSANFTTMGEEQP